MGPNDDAAPATELPKPTPELIGLGSLILALERRMPGLSEELQEIVDSEFMRSRQVVEIRPPKDRPDRQMALASVSAWLSRITLTADAYAGWRKRRKRA